jgi:hypothetical protein
MLRHIAFFAGIIGCLVLGNAYGDNYDDWRHFDFKKQHGKDSALTFEASLTGAQEVTNPPGGVDTDRTARAIVSFDKGFTELQVKVKLSNSDSIVAAHFHCNRAGHNGPVVFGLISPGQLGIENNMIKGTLTNADYSGADCTGPVGRAINNLASLAFAMRDGLIYLNVHSMNFPAGEIRGQMLEQD